MDGNQCVDFSRMVEQLTMMKSATLTVNTQHINAICRADISTLCLPQTYLSQYYIPFQVDLELTRTTFK